MNNIRFPLLGSIALIVCLTLGGCSTLLPTAKQEVVSDWNSYDDAVKSLSTVEPYKATRADVHANGLDPRTNSAITVLHFADVLQKFPSAAMIRPEDVDRGIRDCLQAGKRCSGYTIAVKKLDHMRVGSFWLDSLNFKREAVSKGWEVDALLVFVDDQLVYELVGGRPTIDEYEVVRNPLGPLQGWGNLAFEAFR
jgi:hypothetical protein